MMKEYLKIKECKYLLTLTKLELKAIVYDSSEYKEDGSLYSWNNYHSQVIKYLKQVIHNKGVMDVDYKYASGNDFGRLYSKEFSLQSLQHKIRGFITDDSYHDYDLKNAHPTIMQYLCEKHNISTPYLDTYCKNREDTLKTYDITKRCVLVALNSDHLKTKNPWLVGFNSEMNRAKVQLLEFFPNIETYNKKNPRSSMVNLVICKYENEIIQLVVNTLKGNDYSLFFDGILTREKLCIETLNDLVSKYNITWTEKIKNQEIEMPCNWKDPDTIRNEELKQANELYIKLKSDFEKTNCMVKSPLGYMSLVGKDYVMYTHEKFKILHQDTPMLKGDDGKNIRFVSKWLMDEKKLKYTSLDFVPYNKEHPVLYDKFNTFVPFGYLDEYTEPNMEFIENYVHILIFNLCGTDINAYNYLLKYIAFLIQYPNRLCEQSIVMLSKAEGVGKDRLTYMIEKLLDNRNYTFKTGNPDSIFGQFNQDADRKIMIQINEQSNKSALDYLETFKDRTTAEYFTINPKGQPAYITRNCMRLFIASNNKKPVVLSETDRRFVVINSTDTLKQDHEFFGAFMKGVDDKDTISGVFHYFNNMDLTGWSSKDMPKTLIKQNMILENRPPLISFLQEFVENVHLPSDVFHLKKDSSIWRMKKIILRKKYLKYCESSGLSVLGITASKFNRDILEFEPITQIKTKLDGVYGQTCFSIKRTELYNLLEAEYPQEKIEVDDSENVGNCDITTD